MILAMHGDGPPHRPYTDRTGNRDFRRPPPLLLPQALNMSTYNCSPHVNYAQVMGPLRIACLNTIMGI
jgi:hypothetical protein